MTEDAKTAPAESRLSGFRLRLQAILIGQDGRDKAGFHRRVKHPLPIRLEEAGGVSDYAAYGSAQIASCGWVGRLTSKA
jgi:hypothetical protein